VIGENACQLNGVDDGAGANDEMVLGRLRAAIDLKEWRTARNILTEADADELTANEVVVLYPALLSAPDIELQKDVLARMLRRGCQQAAVVSKCLELRNSNDAEVRSFTAAVVRRCSIPEGDIDTVASWLEKSPDSGVTLYLIDCLRPWPKTLEWALLRKQGTARIVDDSGQMFSPILSPLLLGEEPELENVRAHLLGANVLPAAYAVRLARADTVPHIIERAQESVPLQRDFYRRCVAVLDPTCKWREAPNEIKFVQKGEWDHWTEYGEVERSTNSVNTHFATMLAGRVRKRDGAFPSRVQLRFVTRADYEKDPFWFAYNSKTGTFYLFCVLPARFRPRDEWAVRLARPVPIATGIKEVVLRIEESVELNMELRMGEVLSEVTVD
jgi:hypothetical protein